MLKPTTLFQEYIKIVKAQKWTFAILVLMLVISEGIELISPLYYRDLANIFAQNFTPDVSSGVECIYITFGGVFCTNCCMENF